MIFAILKSMDALVWVFAVLIFFNYMFALVFMYAATEAFENTGRDRPSEGHLANLEEYFGGLLPALLTLFQSITNGRDWSDVFDCLSEVSYAYGVFFIGYVYFTVFLVMNVVIGTVVDVTTRVSQRDHGRVVREELNRVREYTNDIRDFFDLADVNGSGTLSWSELARFLEEDEKHKAHFQAALDLDLRQAHTLFQLLDEDEDGEVGIREFLEGCIRLKGQARSIDLHLAVFQLQRLAGRCSSVSPACSEHAESSVHKSGTASAADLHKALKQALPPPPPPILQPWTLQRSTEREEGGLDQADLDTVLCAVLPGHVVGGPQKGPSDTIGRIQ